MNVMTDIVQYPPLCAHLANNMLLVTLTLESDPIVIEEFVSKDPFIAVGKAMAY